MTIKELEKECKRTTLHLHHTATSRGYIRKGWTSVDKYDGRFGKGFVVHNQNSGTNVCNAYHYVDYYVY